MLRDLARQCGHTPKDALEGYTFGQFYVLWCRKPNIVPGLDMPALRDKINKRRQELGLPAMRKPTAEDRRRAEESLGRLTNS